MEVVVEAERDSTQRKPCETTDAEQGQPRPPKQPQADLAANDQTQKIARCCANALAGFRQVPQHHVAVSRFQGAGQDAEQPPADARHDETLARSTAQDTPRLARLTALKKAFASRTPSPVTRTMRFGRPPARGSRSSAAR